MIEVSLESTWLINQRFHTEFIIVLPVYLLLGEILLSRTIVRFADVGKFLRFRIHSKTCLWNLSYLTNKSRRIGKIWFVKCSWFKPHCIVSVILNSSCPISVYIKHKKFVDSFQNYIFLRLLEPSTTFQNWFFGMRCSSLEYVPDDRHQVLITKSHITLLCIILRRRQKIYSFNNSLIHIPGNNKDENKVKNTYLIVSYY